MAILSTPEFWVAVSFFLFVGAVLYFGAHKKIAVALDARSEAIAQEIDEAKHLREEAEKVLADYREKQGNAAKEAQAIIDLASRDAETLAAQRRACKVAARAAKAVPTMCSEGMTEIDLMGEIAFHMAGQGALGGGMASFGAHTSYPHVATGHRRLKKGDFIMVDLGTQIDGIGSDITRTFVFGKASPEQKALYNEVHKAHLLSFKLIKKKKDVRQINAAVNELFQADGFGPFIHSIGHGLGGFGGPFLNKTGAVNTVEPGLYIPGFGGVRIEDDILMTAPGRYELLTAASPRSKLIEI